MKPIAKHWRMFNLRVPREMFAFLEQEAMEEGRSVNAQIVEHLRKATGFRYRDFKPAPRVKIVKLEKVGSLPH